MQTMKMLIVTWLVTKMVGWVEKKLINKKEKGGSYVQKSV